MKHLGIIQIIMASVRPHIVQHEMGVIRGIPSRGTSRFDRTEKEEYMVWDKKNR